MRRLAIAGLLIAGCARREEGEALPPIVEAPAPTPDRVVAAGPVDLTPVTLAENTDWIGCDLVLADGTLYWLTKRMAPAGKQAAASCGQTLDCARTRGTVWRVAAAGGPKEEVAQVMDWPWRLEADAAGLYFIGHCTAQLWRVARAGGTPVAVGDERLSIVDHLPMAGRIYVADRFGAARGLYTLGDGAPRIFAAEGGAPWLMGVLGRWVIWGEDGTAYAGMQAGERVALGAYRGNVSDSAVLGGALIVRTSNALFALSPAPPAVRELTGISEYLDRGGLAVDGRYVYWANGKVGTISRMDPSEGVVHDAQIGGEPCGVAVDGESLYWIDRGREAVMRAPLAVYN